ncbi:MAG: nucleotidyltransferase domain-containing protein [Candidatus Nanoarchaeia archaeon]|nr:nucleotidyltransferase domain-containing protein [Candidatus Nanoarchaeia archaeon]MDD5740721.1 nucleotidyltransferase domain-containing protein [Candidatus Nanoarchaeia archaeon]
MAEEKNKESSGKQDHETSLDDKKYQNPELKDASSAVPSQPSEKDEKEMKKLREKLEGLKKFICSKYKFVEAIGIIPPQAAEMFDEENELNEEDKKNKPMHLIVVLPEDKAKEFNEVKLEIVKKIKEDKLKIWLNLFLERDLWEICLDSKYNIIEAIGMAFPLFDKGILGALRVAQIHKSLVLRKFEKYVYSYVIGGSLVRGETQKTSDVDTYIIIDDTDVKRMPRLELKDKLRNIIYSYIMQAGELAGVQNKLNVQVYLLTEFWDGVKDANPIFYTFLRDGFPLYDRGGFLPWKLLLRMGKIKPSPEAIDGFMSVGDKTSEIVKRRLLDIVIGDIYWGISMPTQGLLMLYGLPPTNVKETVAEFRRIFVEKEKLVEKRYADTLEEVMIKYYKGYEHEKIKEVSGKEVDKLLKDSEDYLKKLKELRIEIEKRMMRKSFEEIYANVFKIMKAMFGNKTESGLISDYEKEIVNKAKGNPKFIHTLHELVEIKKKYNTKKAPGILEFESLRKDSVYLIESLVEYAQRKELGLLEKTKVVISYKGKHAELFLTNPAFLVEGDKIKKVTDKIENSDVNELNKALAEYRGHRVKMDNKLLILLKKELGEFDINL